MIFHYTFPYCVEPAISLHSHHVSLVQWTTRLLPVMRDPGSNPQGGTYVKPEYLLLALSRYISDPDVIRSLASSPLRCFTRLQDDLIDLITQLFCPGFTLATGSPSSFTTDGVGCWGEPCEEPAISLHSHHVSLVQWTTRLLPVMRDPGSNPQGGTYIKSGYLLLALSRYTIMFAVNAVNYEYDASCMVYGHC
jgi:hypothetical protein